MRKSPMKRSFWKKRRSPMRAARPKKQRREMKDGRLILSGSEWQARKIEVWGLDNCCCVKCGVKLDPPRGIGPTIAEIHHVFGRGMAGGKRDDRSYVFKEGGLVRNLITLCPSCHRKETPI
jgi:5-methylcytosine-specific restriction endonuclease McrA